MLLKCFKHFIDDPQDLNKKVKRTENWGGMFCPEGFIFEGERQIFLMTFPCQTKVKWD